MKTHTLLLALAALLLAACRPDAAVPTDSEPLATDAHIYPDYRDITVPPNIAPLNIQVREEADAYVGQLQGPRGEALVAAAGSDGKLMYDSLQWRALLADAAGDSLRVTLYARRDGRWYSYRPYTIRVAAEPIDRYLSYRLIEPGYEQYRQLGLYQRDLTTFGVRTIYENNRTFDAEHNHCINCHNFQNYDTRRMLFHVRSAHGGTVIADGGRLEKLNMKTDSTLASAVYPSWHPTRNWIAFSTNLTGQAFHIIDKQKIEVIDYGSDLLFYDADSHTVSNILKTDTDFETFPCWSPDGLRLYYCSAHVPWVGGLKDMNRADVAIQYYDSLRYNLMSLPFDPATRRFGSPRVELRADSMGLSASVPRVSPDGRWLLFTLGKFGQFHIWHKTSDLYVKDLHTGAVRPLTAANSDDVDSYHTWSSNGRWIVFSSRRDDGSYTRPYIAYFDADGRDHKAFMLPQEDPEHSLLLLKSYNVPELTRTPVGPNAEEFRHVIYDTDARPVSYK